MSLAPELHLEGNWTTNGRRIDAEFYGNSTRHHLNTLHRRVQGHWQYTWYVGSEFGRHQVHIHVIALSPFCLQRIFISYSILDDDHNTTSDATHHSSWRVKAFTYVQIMCSKRYTRVFTCFLSFCILCKKGGCGYTLFCIQYWGTVLYCCNPFWEYYMLHVPRVTTCILTHCTTCIPIWEYMLKHHAVYCVCRIILKAQAQGLFVAFFFGQIKAPQEYAPREGSRIVRTHFHNGMHCRVTQTAQHQHHRTSTTQSAFAFFGSQIHLRRFFYSSGQQPHKPHGHTRAYCGWRRWNSRKQEVNGNSQKQEI